jgi:hypothetical protein
MSRFCPLFSHDAWAGLARAVRPDVAAALTNHRHFADPNRAAPSPKEYQLRCTALFQRFKSSH